jgi:hypothetical protein
MGKLSKDILGLVVAVFGVIALSGCTTLYQQAVAVIRQPGEQIATAPDQVWQEMDCSNRERPFVRAESMEVLPEMIRPGGRVNYRLIYVMCPAKPSEIIKTHVARRMLFKGEQVARNVNDAFEIKPGRWVVDSFFTLPADSPLGVYALEVIFEAPNGMAHKKVRSFVVSNESYLSGGG